MDSYFLHIRWLALPGRERKGGEQVEVSHYNDKFISIWHCAKLCERHLRIYSSIQTDFSYLEWGLQSPLPSWDWNPILVLRFASHFSRWLWPVWHLCLSLSTCRWYSGTWIYVVDHKWFATITISIHRQLSTPSSNVFTGFRHVEVRLYCTVLPDTYVVPTYNKEKETWCANRHELSLDIPSQYWYH